MLDYGDCDANYHSLYDMECNLKSLGLDTDQLTTCLGCHWEMEKLEYYLDRLVQCLLENRVPKILALALIDEAEDGKKELRKIFDELHSKENRA